MQDKIQTDQVEEQGKVKKLAQAQLILDGAVSNFCGESQSYRIIHVHLVSIGGHSKQGTFAFLTEWGQ